MTDSKSYKSNKKILQKIKGLSLANTLPKYLRNYQHTNGDWDMADSPFTNDGSASHFRVDKKSNTWSDFAMTDSKYRFGDLIGFVQIYFDLDFLQALKKITEDFKDQLNGKTVVYQNFYKSTTNLAKPDAVKDLAYRCLMKISFLTKADRETLHKKRHLSDQEISQYKLFSMPLPTKTYRAKLRAIVASNGKIPQTKVAEEQWIKQYGTNSPELFKRMKEIFEGVPGFYIENNEITWNRVQGVAIPSMTFNFITGIQIRKRNPKQGQARYVWFSSSNRATGASAGSPINLFQSSEKAENKWNPLIVTEGFFKGLQYHKQFPTAHVAALPGVGNFKDLNSKIIDRLLKNKFVYKLDHIIIGYDADSLVNKQVLEQEIRLYKKIMNYHLPVYVFYWNLHEGKGFDDLVFNHPNDFKKYLHLEPFEVFIKHFIHKKNEKKSN